MNLNPADIIRLVSSILNLVASMLDQTAGEKSVVD